MNQTQTFRNPIISVIIPLYNHEAYIGEAVESVLNQTIQDFELIIINDGSSDNSESVVKGISDKRIRYYSQDNQGAHNTINKGIGIARGDYICILNSDDVFDFNRFERCLDVIEADGSVCAVFSHMEWIDGDGGHIRYQNGAKDNWGEHQSETSFRGDDHIFLDLLAGNFLTTTSNLFCRKSVFNEIEGFRNLRYAHDYDLFLRLCIAFDTRIIPEPLLKYRIHERNTINENKPETFFELGLIYADLMIHHNLRKVIPGGDDYDNLVKFFHSISPHFSERMIMTLFFYTFQYGTDKNFFSELTENPENPFRKACIGYLQKKFEETILLSEYPSKLDQAQRTIDGKNKKITELNRTLHEERFNLQKEKEQVELYNRSTSLRVGRLLTEPVKKIQKMIGHFSFLQTTPDDSTVESARSTEKEPDLLRLDRPMVEEQSVSSLDESYKEISELFGN